jgi:GTP-binding protein
MSFVDKVNINLVAGKGGDGKRSFRHERFIARGGPDGGDGGNGGDVILRASQNSNTLSSFRHTKLLAAKEGQPGGKNKRHGKSGESLVIDVPVGTEVSNSDGKILADLVINDNQEIIAKGGRGGFGNAHFTSSTRQAPNFAEKGEPGEKLTVTLELKLIADVGIIGLPNAGKSTLLSRMSNARPEIADYPFTTLTPNLGVVDIDSNSSILLADIPGLIEGAALGKGLGHEFLRHIERTRVIVHLVDIYDEDVKKSYNVIRNELLAYSPKFIKLTEVVALNKIDGCSQELIAAKLNELNDVAKGSVVTAISAQAGTNLNELKYTLKRKLDDLDKVKKPKEKKSLPRISLKDTEDSFKVIRSDNSFRITGVKIEKFASRTDFSNVEATNRFKDILKKTGVLHELSRQGIKPDDKVYIGQDNNMSFNF